MSSKRLVETRKLTYPKDLCDPKDWLNFVQLDAFPRAWKRLGFGDLELRALEIMIMMDPTRSPVIAGTGGLRKIRFARADEDTGKRGGARICYTHFPDHGLVTLFTAYGKNQTDDLTTDQKKKIKKLIKEIEEYLSRGS